MLVIVVVAWIFISCSIVAYAALIPRVIYHIPIINQLTIVNNSSPCIIEYKDTIGFYLNSMLTSALVIVGSVELFKLFDEKEKRKKKEQKKKKSKKKQKN